jgi:hypothetical protein
VMSATVVPTAVVTAMVPPPMTAVPTALGIRRHRSGRNGRGAGARRGSCVGGLRERPCRERQRRRDSRDDDP